MSPVGQAALALGVLVVLVVLYVAVKRRTWNRAAESAPALATITRFCSRCGGEITVAPGKVLLREDGVAIAAEELESLPGAVAHAVCPDPDAPLPHYYEARLGLYRHEGAVPEAFGTGGEEMAHLRAVVEAPSFADAVAKLDEELGRRWRAVQASAHLADASDEGHADGIGTPTPPGGPGTGS